MEPAASFQRIQDPEASLPDLGHEELLAFEYRSLQRMILRFIAVDSSLHKDIQPSHLQRLYLSKSSFIPHTPTRPPAGSTSSLVVLSHQKKRIPAYLQSADCTDAILVRGEVLVEECV